MAKSREFADGRLRVVLTPPTRDLFDEIEEAGVVGDDVFIRVRSGGGQRAYNEAHGLEVAQPFLMSDKIWVSGHDVTPSPARGRRGRPARCAGL